MAAPGTNTLLAGRTLTRANPATDSDLPAQTLKWRLLTPLAGTTFNTNNGVFIWRPAIAQSPTTNLLSVFITDNGLPLMSATENFTVIVQQPQQQPLLGPPSLTNGAIQFSITGDAGPDYLLRPLPTSSRPPTGRRFSQPTLPPRRSTDPARSTSTNHRASSA